MLSSRVLRLPRKPFVDLDYAKHMPAAYVEKVKRTVPRKTFGDRFGAPDIKMYYVHPDDYVPSHRRPWEDKQLSEHLHRADKYFSAQLSNKFMRFRYPKNERIADTEWTFFPGDLVQVMVGKDKGRQGLILTISRDTSEVIVDGLHTKLGEDMEGSDKLGVDKTLRWQLNGAGDEYIRVSTKSGYEIPIPSQAKVTYEYLQPENYIEVEGKDTPADLVLTRTYIPKVASFEQEIMEEIGIKETRTPKPTYWY
uniref:Large ribosomal subunit protein uL24m n=1 Tax=Caenorhabditis japonica TaxID=281687 RepID=A0A8R1DSK2_CAEJA